MTRTNDHDIQFLRYLDALENADLDGIADFLTYAEQDSTLEDMLIEHHREEYLMKTYTYRPFFLPNKRKHKPRKRLSSTLVATLLLTLIGVAAVLISVQTNQSLPLTTTLDLPLTAPVNEFGYGGAVLNLDEHTIGMMRRAGMEWVKYQVQYKLMDELDTQISEKIAEAHAAGFRVIATVVGSPQEVLTAGYAEQYAAFVGTLAAAGADAIEIWHEQNIDRTWPQDQLDPVMYTTLLKEAYGQIKAVNPNAFVITGGLAPTGAENAFPGQVINDDRYLREMVAAGALDYADCVGMQYTEGIVPPTQRFGDTRDDYYTRYFSTMVETYWQIIDGQRPLCLMEMGYLAGAEIENLPVFTAWAKNTTAELQAAWLTDAIQLARLSERIRLVSIWNLNAENDEPGIIAGYSLIQDDGECLACSIDMKAPIPLLEIVTVSNAGNINGESVVIRSPRRNVGVTLNGGWELQDLDGNRYILFDSVRSFNRMQIPVYTHDQIPAAWNAMSLGLHEPIWESGDIAILRDSYGRIHDLFQIPENADNGQ